MSCFETIGYGYSRILSQDIATWFINKFLSEYDLYVRIAHKGLKRQNSFGFCDCLSEEDKTKVFVVDIQSKLPHTLYAKTLLHEFVHVHQFLKGELETKSGKTFFNGECVEKYEYMEQPHEIEAYGAEDELFTNFMYDTYGEWLGDQ